MRIVGNTHITRLCEPPWSCIVHPNTAETLQWKRLQAMSTSASHSRHAVNRPSTLTLSSESYSRKYDKLPTVVIHQCYNISETMTFFKKCCPQIWLSLFMFWPISLKQLNTLTSIDTFSCLNGLDVTHQTVMREFPDLIPGFGKDLYVCLFVLLLGGFTFLSKIHYLSWFICIFFSNVNSFSILYILQNMWPIIIISRYRPIIFKHGRLSELFYYLYMCVSSSELALWIDQISCLLLFLNSLMWILN